MTATAPMELFSLTEDFKIWTSSIAELEMRHIYKEIFEDKCYDVATLPSDALIIDAGCNIGLFSVWAKKRWPSSRILAFEPMHQTMELFRRNKQLHGLTNVEEHECGLGAAEGTTTLTYYPKMPGNSSIYGAEKARTIDFCRTHTTSETEREVLQALSETLEVKVEIKRLSEFLRRVPDLRRVDLLKIDVEGAEMDVLLGIDDEHWALVDNIAMEICNDNGGLDKAQDLLQSKGFHITKEAAEWSKTIPIYLVIARRVESS